MDVQTVSTLKCDSDGDGTYSYSYTVDINSPTTAADAFLYPINGYPKTVLAINPNGDYSDFAGGVLKGIQIVGKFGYGNDWPSSYLGTLNILASDCTSTAASMTVSTGSYFSAGQTLRIDSEQMYVYQPTAGNTVYIERAVNGTSATSHTSSTTIYVYKYPQSITKAVLIETTRQWKRKDEGFVTGVIGGEGGYQTVYSKIDPFTKQVIDRYKRRFLWA